MMVLLAKINDVRFSVRLFLLAVFPRLDFYFPSAASVVVTRIVSGVEKFNEQINPFAANCQTHPPHFEKLPPKKRSGP